MRIGVQSGRGARMLLACAAIGMCAAVPVRGQEADAAKPREEATGPERSAEDLVMGEGLLRDRAEYFASRHRNSDDPAFNAAKARFEAAREMRGRAPVQDGAVMSGFAPAANPNVWQNI